MARKGLDPNALARIRHDLNTGLDDAKVEAPSDPTQFVKPSFIASGHDIGPYFVGTAKEYYQGPALSTRVSAHSFIPVDFDGVPFVVKNQSVNDNYQPQGGQMRTSNAKYADTKLADYENGPYGFVFVRFQRPRDLFVYGTDAHIPLSVYRTFRDYYSKGRAVTHMLESYGYMNANGFKYGAGVAGI
jgi:hypothetical protein